MRRLLEALFRRLGRVLLLLVLLPLIGFAIGFKMPRMYESVASIWAVQRYVVIGATGAESDLLATPAQTQTDALTELLQTRVFDLEVANQTHLADTLDPATRANPSLRDDALVAEISSHVQVKDVGTNLFTVTYDNKSPQIAQQVVAATIKSYGEQSQGLTVIEGQNLLEAYQAQLPAVQAAATKATQAEEQYIAQHPNENSGDLNTDPAYLQLHAATQAKQGALDSIQAQISQIQQELGLLSGGPNSLYEVLDQPIIPVRAVSRTKTLLVTAGAGLGLALLACLLYLAILVRRDRAFYTPAEVQNATQLRVLMQLPALSTSAVVSSRRALVGPVSVVGGRRGLRAPRT